MSSRLRRQCEELLVTARVSANLVVVRTPSGAANYLASAIDHADEADIMGTIAGDDTIMIITSGEPQSQALASRLLALAGRQRATPNSHPSDHLDHPARPPRRHTDDDINKEFR